jgi:hypothetical protein
MSLALVATLAFAAFGGWWMFLRDPVGTPERALARYAEGLASQNPADLAPCMYIDPVVVPDADERARRREEAATKYISVRETVVGAAQARKMTVVETLVKNVNGNHAEGEIVMDIDETTGSGRRRYVVQMELQDDGWRVRHVGYTEEPRS